MRIRVRRSQRNPTPHYYPNLKVNHKNRELLEPLVELGKSQISAFMRETKVNFVPVPALNVHIILRTRILIPTVCPPTKVPMDIMLEFMHDKFDGSGADLFNLANSTHATKKSRSC
jgi:hypothetical protein